MATPKRSLRIGSLLVAGGVILVLGVVYLAAPQLLTQAELTLYDQHMRLLQGFIGRQAPLDRALLLLYLDERPQREIAEILGITESNVSTKIGRLKQRIRHEL